MSPVGLTKWSCRPPRSRTDGVTW